jgi:hypothetical protein
MQEGCKRVEFFCAIPLQAMVGTVIREHAETCLSIIDFPHVAQCITDCAVHPYRGFVVITRAQ